MAFYGSSFIYDGISSEQYGLVLASFDGNKQSEGNIGGELTIHEDRINRRSTGLHYGTTANTPLSFPVVFTVCEDNKYLDRFDVAAVAGWLTGHQQYKTLTICQPDFDGIFYRALIVGLTACEVSGRTVGFNATVMCDGPYAYRGAADTIITVAGSADVVYRNLSNVNDYYRPMIEIETSGDVVIRNETDGSVFSLTGLGTDAQAITIDCANQVMVSDSDINLYQHWNVDFKKTFPRFVRGDNHLVIEGQCTLKITNQFPWNIGN